MDGVSIGGTPSTSDYREFSEPLIINRGWSCDIQNCGVPYVRTLSRIAFTEIAAPSIIDYKDMGFKGSNSILDGVLHFRTLDNQLWMEFQHSELYLIDSRWSSNLQAPVGTSSSQF